VWVATWWTNGQQPGDPTGPWQEQAVTPDGSVAWTASRVFVAGDEVVHEGERYRAAWWTRNQVPGDPHGPWTPLG
jgi:chitodextrinase